MADLWRTISGNCGEVFLGWVGLGRMFDTVRIIAQCQVEIHFVVCVVSECGLQY